MSWEPWFAAVLTNTDSTPAPDPDPDDPSLLKNIFRDDPEADPDFIRQWARGDFDDPE